jgi:pyruvate dehydrogenase E2 component (dihydrolipoamide acetyltransferase)
MSARIVAVTMPKWGIEMQEGAVNGWNVALGQSVHKGDALLDVETEKIVNQVEAPGSGVLRRRFAEAGESHPVGALIGILAAAEVSDAEIDAFVRDFRPADASFDGARVAGSGSAAAPTPAPIESAETFSADAEARVSPIARRLAAELGVDLASVRGTGRNGRISKEDVEAAAAARAGSASPVPATATAASDAGDDTPAVPVARERLSATRQTIARRLGESKQTIPHYRVGIDLDLDRCAERRAALRAAGSEVSLNDLLLHALARTLVEHPRLNARFVDGDLLRFDRADVAIAVATDQGLITPVLRSADRLSLEQIGARSRALAARARAGSLTREDIADGTFTLSNLGMFGVREFDAIINPPQVAILAVGAAERRPVVRSESLAIGLRASVTLSADHRVVDGADAGRFLAALAARLASAADPA